MPIMYVAGPLVNGGKLTFDQGLENWRKTCKVAERLMQKGWAPYVPHHSIYMWKYVKEELGRDISWEEWMQLDSAFIKQCRALFFIGHSKGADRELKYALDHFIPVFYAIDDVPIVNPEIDLIEDV